MTRFNKASDFKNNPARVNQALYNRAKKNMSPEDLKKYEEVGEKMYNSIDFNTNTVLDQQPENEIESVACLIEAIKSGLHPEYMSEDEVAVLKKHYGEEWLEVLKTKFRIAL